VSTHTGTCKQQRRCLIGLRQVHRFRLPRNHAKSGESAAHIADPREHITGYPESGSAGNMLLIVVEEDHILRLRSGDTESLLEDFLIRLHGADESGVHNMIELILQPKLF
ncbi:MAG TPA: hypothetical protein VJB57_11580, partial [Dehalococcoidia bacterium]|nr:hypothetical protein [Dehalococcoidia bacterium]